MDMTMKYRIIALLIMAGFYAVYIGKMISQRRHGIVTNQIAKDKSDMGRYRVELLMKMATYLVIVAEIISIICGYSLLRYSGETLGIVLGVIGDIFFATAVFTMADSWRAGVAAEEHRKLVVKGIFKISRNPAFVGFDLVYISILLMFFNWFLLVFTIFPIVMLHLQMLQEEKYLIGEFGEEYVAYKKKVCRYLGLRNWKFWVAAFVLFIGIVVAIIASLNKKTQALPDMSFKECMAYTTKGNSDAVITVGIYKNGQFSYKVYGENGQELEPVLHDYEIGSLTKTITATLIHRAEIERKLSITDTIDKYLDLKEGNLKGGNLAEGKAYPTIEALLTHTSGYEGYYLDLEMMYDGVVGGNPFRYVTGSQILSEAAKHVPGEGNYDWNYSNFGYALLGLVVEEVYGDTYMSLVNELMQELDMTDSSFRKEQGDLGNCWTWEIRDAYASAGAVKSNVMDMLNYAKLQLEDDFFASMHTPLRDINLNKPSYEALGIHLDRIGMAWVIDDANGFIWHDGGTHNYNSYLGFCPATDTAVVILSNLPPSYRIPATVMGVKLLQDIQ